MEAVVQMLSVFLLTWYFAGVPGLVRKPHPCPIDVRTDGHLVGHLEQLGCQRPPLGPIREYVDPPTPRELWENHVKPYTPAVIRNALKGSPALGLWTDDEYLTQTYGDQEVLIEKKHEDRKTEPKRMKIKEFLQNYHMHNWYVVSILPNAMRQDIRVPRPLMCSTFQKNLAELNLWIGTNGTRSMLHYDADNILHCVVTGLKDWILIHPDNKPKLDMVVSRDGQNSGFSHLNVDSIDENINPEVWDVTWQYVTLKDGDCLYLPYQYLHQVRSYDRTISSTFLFYPDKNFSDEDCKNVNYDEYQSLKDTYVYWTYEKGQETVDMGYMNPETVRTSTVEVMHLVGKEKVDSLEFMYLMLVLHDATEPGSGTAIAEYFEKLDTDSDGYVTVGEVRNADTEVIKRYCRNIEAPHGPTKSEAPHDKKLSSKSPDFNPRRSDRHMDSRFAAIFLDFVLRVKGKNGQLTYPEFKKHVEIAKGSIADAFILFDQNFDGVWTKADFKNVSRKRLRDFSRMRYSLKGTAIRGGGMFENELEENDLTYLKTLKEIPKELIVTPETKEEESKVENLAMKLREFFVEISEVLAEEDTLDADTLKGAVEEIEKDELGRSFDFKIFFKFIDRYSKGYISREDAQFFAKEELESVETEEKGESMKPSEFLAQLILYMNAGKDLEQEMRGMPKVSQESDELLQKTEL